MPNKYIMLLYVSDNSFEYIITKLLLKIKYDKNVFYFF